MAFGGQVDHPVRLKRLEFLTDRLAVAHVGGAQPVPWTAGRLRNRREVPGVGQLVDIEDVGAAAPHQVANDRGADEAAATGDQDMQRARTISAG